LFGIFAWFFFHSRQLFLKFLFNVMELFSSFFVDFCFKILENYEEGEKSNVALSSNCSNSAVQIISSQIE